MAFHELILTVLSFSLILQDSAGSDLVNHHVAHQETDERIVGGDEAKPHSAPYMVYLVINKERPHEYELCGGTLISKNYVLTAAHCLWRNRTIEYMILGAHNRWRGRERKKIYGGTYVIHEDYDKHDVDHDLAIIKLPSEITTNENISIVTLPTLNQTNATYVGKSARAFGWGFIHNYEEADVLNTVEVPVISNKDCKNLTLHTTIHDDDLCTSGNDKKGMCHGDSGGPLLVDNVQIGVASRLGGFSCETSRPSVWVSVSHHLGWIEKHSDVKFDDTIV